MEQIHLKAFGKINIGLDVTGRRDDGYHLVRMIMQTVDLYDEVSLKKQDAGISVKTNKPFIPNDERNLAYKAARVLMDAYNIREGVRIDIGKRIPVAAGMAGGSTDAAAVLKGMNALFSLNIDEETMDAFAVKLGADVPFCLRKGTYLAEGIGEELTKLPDIPPCFCLLVNPGFGVSTKEVYQKIDEIDPLTHPQIDRTIEGLGRKSIEDVALSMGNVLELAVIPDHPEIAEIKEIMMENGALGAMMSGSGPTVFGLFRKEEYLDRAFGAFEGEKYDKFKIKF
ncbi:MAG: 4-(cytidine 5'-diphospho)-2-C-methyl-D-erythritol kinase [Parasporobacterium sp.]|nr:4-(cytidine 5'-diphospho)-2-C-methyl-D-erythritol kinase [Parasporobacterium sp.]MBR3642020.1 4-(cytidine 5'-diphospho)-2-C-methyl-D-erythritol kinase [Parasporobacterium sp.]